MRMHDRTAALLEAARNGVEAEVATLRRESYRHGISSSEVDRIASRQDGMCPREAERDARLRAVAYGYQSGRRGRGD